MHQADTRLPHRDDELTPDGDAQPPQAETPEGERSAQGVAVDRDTFRSIMGGFAAGVAIVTTLDSEDRPAGLTTTAVCSVSADPAALLVCIDHDSRTLPALRHTRRFIVHFMDSEAAILSLRFSSKSPDKFRDIWWGPGPSGLPLLTRHVLTWAQCETDFETTVGDHAVIIARIVDGAGPAAESPPEPLIYFDRQFGHWQAATH